jgi:hypothetical protein
VSGKSNLAETILRMGMGCVLLFLISGTWFVVTSDFPVRVSAVAYLRTIPFFLIGFLAICAAVSVVHFIEQWQLKRREK